MRRAWTTVLLLGCTRAPAHATQLAGTGQDVAIESTHAGLDEPTLTALRAAMAASGTLYWRLSGPEGPRCEPWHLEPDAADPSRGQLVHHAAPLHFRYRYQLGEDQLQLAGPERERDLTPVPGAVGVASLALPCVFSGMSFTPDSKADPRRLILAGRERWFLDLDHCTTADPDPSVTAPGELRPLGCASALADPQAREYAEHTGPPGPAALRLLTARTVWLLRRRDDRTTCEAWRRESTDERRGTLTLQHRDEHGPRTLAYGYAIAGDNLTLLGPHEFRRLRKPPGELARAGGCLLTRTLHLRADTLTHGDDPWYLRRRDCEHARRNHLAPNPDPDCGAAPLAASKPQ
jgi:hypothetical protein